MDVFYLSFPWGVEMFFAASDVDVSHCRDEVSPFKIDGNGRESSLVVADADGVDGLCAAGVKRKESVRAGGAFSVEDEV